MFYRPDNAALADVIPFYYKGIYYLYYLKDYRNIVDKGEGVDWNLLTTTDFVDFKDCGSVILHGAVDEQDLYAFTGSIIEHNGLFYCFYTGHNSHFFPNEDRPQQAILLATSKDLYQWDKQKDFYLKAPDFFEPHDFRDPFVFLDDENNEFVMLLAARNKSGASRRRGVTAYATSDNLFDWRVSATPFYQPDQYYTHECPDVFKKGEWWYLIFSEFTDRCCTRYRMAKSLVGPWLTPSNDMFDNRNFYAAKTATDGKQTFLFGWNPSAVDEKDNSLWQWGGSLTVHQILQNKDGTLRVCCPQSIINSYSKNKLPAIDNLEVGVEGKYRVADIGDMSKKCLIEFEFEMADMTQECGVAIFADDVFECSYYVKFEPAFNRMSFDKWPRGANEKHFFVESERQCKYKKRNKAQIIIDDTIIVVYLNESYALSYRMYDRQIGKLGLYSTNTVTRFSKLIIKEK